MLAGSPHAFACRSSNIGSLTRIGVQRWRTDGSSAALIEISGPMPAASPVAIAIFGLCVGFMFDPQRDLCYLRAE